MYRIKIKEFFQKFDFLLLILAWPLIPILVAEFITEVKEETKTDERLFHGLKELKNS